MYAIMYGFEIGSTKNPFVLMLMFLLNLLTFLLNIILCLCCKENLCLGHSLELKGIRQVSLAIILNC